MLPFCPPISLLSPVFEANCELQAYLIRDSKNGIFSNFYNFFINLVCLILLFPSEDELHSEPFKIYTPYF